MLHMNRFSAVALALVLAGCGSQEETPAPDVNKAPTLTLEKTSITLNEGEVVEIPFSAIDEETAYNGLSFSIDTSGQPEGSGVFEVDAVNKKFIYRAPWIVKHLDSSGKPAPKTVNTAAALVVTDAGGAKASVRLNVVVNDKNEPVKITMTPPAQAFGYEKTQTPTLLNLFVMESQTGAQFKYAVAETDADDLTVSEPEVGTNKYVFKNDIKAGNASGGFAFTFDVPSIDEASAQFTLTAKVADNDGTAVAVANITIVNEVKLQWAAGTPTEILESGGTQLRYISSEKNTYPAAVSVEITDLNGAPLQEDVPFTLNKTAQTITFPSQPSFIGDKTRLVTLTFSNEVKNASGEVFVAKTKLSTPFVFKDNRDDSFEEQLSVFNKQVSWLENLSTRADEERIGGVVAQHLFLNGLVTHAAAAVIHEQSSQLFSEDVKALNVLAQTTRSALSSGTSEDKVKALRLFSTQFNKIGTAARQFIDERLKSVVAANGADKVKIKAPQLDNIFVELSAGAMVSHYVGNGVYGQYVDAQKKQWAYFPGYEYLDVVDITNNFCMN